MKITMYELLEMVKDGKASDITTNFMFDRKKYNLLAFLDEYTLDINSLNWEIEILEEEKNIPENLPFKNDMKLTIMEVYHELEKYNYKINEIIDYLKNKGDE